MKKTKFLSFLLLSLLCSAGNVWGTELCSATVTTSETGTFNNTTGEAATGCTLYWSSLQAGDNKVTVNSVDYFKMTSSGYVQLKLTSGSFQAGDVLTATVTSNSSNGASVNLKVKSSATSTVSVKSTETKNITYTLTANDIESDGSIKISRGSSNGDKIRVAIFSVTGTRAATYTITLYDNNGGVANGSATATAGSNILTSITAPTWDEKGVVGYYQEAGCTHLIADATGNLQASTDYTDANGKWTSTSNQTLYTKWLSANNAKFNDGNYTIGGSALNLSTLFTSSSDGAVTYTVKDANGTGAAIAGSSFTATTAGTATVTVTQAATGTYAPATLDATITVAYYPLGNHSLTWNLKTNVAESSVTTNSKLSTSSYITISNLLNNGLTITSAGKENYTTKIQAPASKDNNKYMYVTITVADGYYFIPKSVSMTMQAVGAAATADVVMSDNATPENHSISNMGQSVNKGKSSTISLSNSNLVAFSGTITMKMYCYGSSVDDYRFGPTITITGIVVEETPEVVSINGTVKYATYHNYSNAYVMPAGLEGIVVAGNEGATLTLNTAYNAGDIVPAHEPLILHAADIDENTNFSLYLTYTASEPKTNMLKGLADNGTTIGEGKHYHLSYDTEDPAGTVGFYYGAADGNPFSLNADKAYLVIPAGSSAPSRFLLNEEENNATNVENIEANEKAVKFIENGRILIKKNGIVYDALGRIVK